MIDEDQRFAVMHAPKARRSAVDALWTVDAAFGQVVATTTEPLIGQMRLTWWHDSVAALRADSVAGQPELEALRVHVVLQQLPPGEVALLIEGWEALLDPLPLPDDALATYARGRGARLFSLTQVVLGQSPSPDDQAGEGWALADFACRCSEEATRRRAFAMARARLSQRVIAPLPRPLRILARLARRDTAAGARSPRSAWALLSSLR